MKHLTEEFALLRGQEACPPQEAARPSAPTSIPCTQLPDAPPDSPITVAWNSYRQLVGRLLAEGHEGKWVLIRDEDIIGIWDSRADADTVRVQLFPMQPVLLKQILAREPILRIGYNRLCPS